MKILWLCNIILPIIARQTKQKAIPLGGWLDGLSNGLIKQNNLELSVLFPFKEELNGSISNLNYHSFNKQQDQTFKKILSTEKPDIIHIFGTEFKHTLEMVNVCKELKILDKVVISIQGLVNYIGKYHYCASLPNDVVKNHTFSTFFNRNNINQQRKKFIIRGKNEIEALSQVKHIIGRTDWDKACTEQVNPFAQYHFCNETLRSSFYENQWDINKCERYSIFLSQGN